MKINNELRSIKALALYNLDYGSLQEEFKDLTQLTINITGTTVCLINLLDADTLWVIAQHGSDFAHIDKTNTICQYTFAGESPFEVKDFRTDTRFNLSDSPFKYYFGVPLITKEGIAIGSLCVLDQQTKELTPSQKEMLGILGRQVMNRLDDFNKIDLLNNENLQLQKQNQIVAHDLRGPLGGILALAKLAFNESQGDSKEDISEYLKLIKESSISVLDLADEILNDYSKTTKIHDSQTSLRQLRDKIYALFAPRLKNKDIEFGIALSNSTAEIPFAKANLQQIIGNLLSNAIKFTPNGGSIIVDLNLLIEANNYLLKIKVTDSGQGMRESTIQAIHAGDRITTEGVNGEVGYGLGLQFVQQLILEKNGDLQIATELGKGSCFTAIIPVD